MTTNRTTYAARRNRKPFNMEGVIPLDKAAIEKADRIFFKRFGATVLSGSVELLEDGGTKLYLGIRNNGGSYSKERFEAAAKELFGYNMDVSLAVS